MPDITMCTGEGCVAKDWCYRYTAPHGEYQSFFTEAPGEDKSCEYFMPNEKRMQGEAV